MKIPIQKVDRIYPLMIWALGIAAVIWSIWLAYQHIDRAVLHPPAAVNGALSGRQHKLNNASYDKVMASWAQKKDQANINTPLVNPFDSRP